MNRSDFFKKLGLGVGAVALTPMILTADGHDLSEKDTSVAIDVPTITGFIMGGRKISPAEVLSLWRQTGVLIYDSDKGNPPMVFKGHIEVVDMKEKRHTNGIHRLK
jgi:hypothetical protein